MEHLLVKMEGGRKERKIKKVKEEEKREEMKRKNKANSEKLKKKNQLKISLEKDLKEKGRNERKGRKKNICVNQTAK